MLIVECVVFEHLTDWFTLLFGDAEEVLADLRDGGIVDVQAKSKLTQIFYHGLQGWLRRAVGQRRDGGMNAISSRFNALEIDQRRHAGQAMAVQLYRSVTNGSTQRRDERANAVDR